MRRITGLCLGGAAVLTIAAVGLGSGSAAAAAQRPTMTAWKAAISRLTAPGKGCYQASYPDLRWHAVKCGTAPRIPLVPRQVSGRGAPNTVGDGTDYSSQVSGLISRAVGTFPIVSPHITETGVGTTNPEAPNAFTLQMNSQFFSGSPTCSGSTDPSTCQAWQQFVYEYNSSTSGEIFMQYWLLDYNNVCPSTDWTPISVGNGTDCYMNSPEADLPGGALTAQQLARVQFTGTAKAGGNDGVSLAVGSGKATLVTNSDSVLSLARHWDTVEWGVFGNGAGTEATFGANTTLTARTVLTSSSSAAPTCLSTGYTGETNNLSLAHTWAFGKASSPTMDSRQTDGSSTGKASCAVAK